MTVLLPGSGSTYIKAGWVGVIHLLPSHGRGQQRVERRVLFHDLRRGQGAKLRRGGRHGLRREQRLHGQQHHGARGPGPLFERRNNVHLLGNVIIVFIFRN